MNSEYSDYFIQIEGVKREITWSEVIQLQKDILWYFDQNVSDPYNTYVPGEFFILPYWDYLTLDKNSKPKDYSELDFLIEGSFVIINGMICQYIPVFTGNNQIFGTTHLERIEKKIFEFKGRNEEQKKLRDITLLGLKVAKETDFSENEENKHPLYPDYLAEMVWVDKHFIQGYFNTKLQ